MAYVTIFMAWPYANGPPHLGHVAGNILPADIQYRYERAMGRKVLMCSGSDEHGTPITLTAEEMGLHPQEVVDMYHDVYLKSLADLGCSWTDPVDPRGIEYGGALYNRTSDPMHKEIVREVFSELLDFGFLEKMTMQQYCSVSGNEIRFLPDRYVEGTCPECSSDGARGDQCDSCGSTYEAHELLNPVSKLDPSAEIEIRDTEHFFLRLNDFQDALADHASQRENRWKPNVRSMTKNWLNMGLRPRAVTRDIDWGITLPLEGDDWSSKRVYVWFEAVQGYYSCARIWGSRYAEKHAHPDGADAWKNWWTYPEEGEPPKHIYFMGKDNIPFHTIIWPAIIMGLNSPGGPGKVSSEPLPGNLVLEDNVSANEYLMLQGDQFSKSRRHAVWLPSYLERYDPDALRYYLSINMPETHDTDFRWDEYADRVNNELIGNFGNFIHRVLTLTNRLDFDEENPLIEFDSPSEYSDAISEAFTMIESAIESMEKQRFKEALRSLMGISQLGNSLLQNAEPWKHIKSNDSPDRSHSLCQLALCWRLSRCLAVTLRPFIPFSSDRLWKMLGEEDDIDSVLWLNSLDISVPLSWSGAKPSPLFSQIDLESIISTEESLSSDSNVLESETTPDDGGNYINFDDFMKIDMRIGRIISVEDHPNADKLFVITIQDSPDSERKVCAGFKGIYDKQELEGLDVVFVANLEPRELRGVLSEGMILAADDGQGNIRVLTPDGDITPGSGVR